MNPIYRTMTGEIQCTMEDGTLFVRLWDNDQQLGRKSLSPWLATAMTAEQAEKDHHESKKERERFAAGCMWHCLTNKRPSAWFHEYSSNEIIREIEGLQQELESVLAKERADRPIPEPVALGEGG